MAAIVCNGRRQHENISDPSCEPFPNEQINTIQYKSIHGHSRPMFIPFPLLFACLALNGAQQRSTSAQDHVQRRQGFGLHDLATGVLHPPVAEV